MIELLSREESGLREALPRNWQETVGFVSDSFSREVHAKPSRPSHQLPIFLCGPCSSSFAVAWSLLAKKHLPVWGSVLALQQWQGRGQKGRKWISPPGNIYASLRLPPPPARWDKLLSLLCGYCLMRAFSHLGFSTTLKWPNDILLAGCKVAGVLLEERGGNILLGVGVNVFSAPSADSLRPGSMVAPTCLNRHSKRSFFALPVWSTLVSLFYFCYQNVLLTLTPSVFLHRLQTNLAFAGEKVSIALKNEEVTGFFSGLSADGGLVLNIAGQKRVFFSGSLLPAL